MDWKDLEEEKNVDVDFVGSNDITTDKSSLDLVGLE
jgi:hypothetical protein